MRSVLDDTNSSANDDDDHEQPNSDEDSSPCSDNLELLTRFDKDTDRDFPHTIITTPKSQPRFRQKKLLK